VRGIDKMKALRRARVTRGRTIIADMAYVNDI
jgi:hypothetical protein